MTKIYSGPNTNATPQWVRDAAKPFRLHYSRELFEPKPFDVGATVTWRDKSTVRTGQVWAHHPAPRTRWVVSEQVAYSVHEWQLEAQLSEPLRRAS